MCWKSFCTAYKFDAAHQSEHTNGAAIKSERVQIVSADHPSHSTLCIIEHSCNAEADAVHATCAEPGPHHIEHLLVVNLEPK